MMTRIAFASLLLVGCSPASQSPPDPAKILAPPPVAPSSARAGPIPQFAGQTFLITAIDGITPATMATDSGERRAPRFGFVERSYGGTSGCNSMGGLYAQVGNRLYTLPGPQTQMACGGRLDEQERVIDAVFAASPALAQIGRTIELRGAGHVLRLERDAAAPTMGEVPTAWQGDALAGQSFVVWSVNGVRSERLARDGWPSSRLSFTRDQMAAKVDCPAASVVSFRQKSRQLEANGVVATCDAPRDVAFAAIIAASPVLVSGPNGELLLASAAGWATAENERRDRPK